jgi:hypothetical protein
MDNYPSPNVLPREEGDKAEAEIPETAERNKLIEFIRGSKRGVIKQYMSRR